MGGGGGGGGEAITANSRITANVAEQVASWGSQLPDDASGRRAGEGPAEGVAGAYRTHTSPRFLFRLPRSFSVIGLIRLHLKHTARCVGPMGQRSANDVG